MRPRLPKRECYKQAAELILGWLKPEDGETLPELSEDAVLVQGTPILRVACIHPPREYGHAWIEDGDKCIDPTKVPALVMDKEKYYSLGRIDPERNPDHAEYTADEVMNALADLKHWGPWIADL